MKKLRKTSQQHRHRRSANTTFEDLSTELVFEIFDYLTGNEIYRAFFGLNYRLNELLHHTPNVHLSIHSTRNRLWPIFRRIYPIESLASVTISYESAKALDTFFNPADRNRLKALSILRVPLAAFETRILDTFNMFKHHLCCVTINFTDMYYNDTGARAAQSFAFLLTELPALKKLCLEYSEGIDPITYIPSTIINYTITDLTLSLNNLQRLAPLLYRFQALRTLHIFYANLPPRKGIRRDDVEYYRSHLGEKTTVDYPIKARQINFYHFPLLLDKMEPLLRLICSPTLVILNFFLCQRPAVRHPLPRRQPPLLDGTHWYDLLHKYLLSSMKRFYIEYDDVDETMSLTNLVRLNKDLTKHNRLAPAWNASCSYDQRRKRLAFHFSPIAVDGRTRTQN